MVSRERGSLSPIWHIYSVSTLHYTAFFPNRNFSTVSLGKDKAPSEKMQLVAMTNKIHYETAFQLCTCDRRSLSIGIVSCNCSGWLGCSCVGLISCVGYGTGRKGTSTWSVLGMEMSLIFPLRTTFQVFELYDWFTIIPSSIKKKNIQKLLSLFLTREIVLIKCLNEAKCF